MELSCPSSLSLPSLVPNRTPSARSPPPLLLTRPKSLPLLSKSGLRCRASEEASTSISQQYYSSLSSTAVDKVEEVQFESVSSAEVKEEEEKFKEKEEEGEKGEGVVGDGEQSGPAEFLNKLNLKLDFADPYSIFLYGTGILVALRISSAVVGAIDSIPVFPKVMEVVGVAYTVWFSYKYLIFKENREELFAKIEDLKKEIIGTSDG